MRKLRVWNFDRLGNADGRMVEWRCFGRRRYAKKNLFFSRFRGS